MGLRRRRGRRLLSALPLLLALGLAAVALPQAAAAEGTVRGTVTELGSGTPIAGARVEAFCWQVPGSTQGASCGQATTASDGTYVLTLAPGTYKVRFDDHPFHRAQFHGGGSTVSSADSLPVVVADGGTAEGIDGALVPLRAVTGTVTGDGAPLAGINVTAHEAGSDPPWQLAQSTLTGPDGSFALHLAAGRYRIGFSDPSGPWQAEFFDDAPTLDAASDVVVGDAPVSGVDADLVANHPISGAVRVDGIDMPGVAVTAYQQPPGSPTWEAVKATTTGEDGRYTLFVPDGTYRVSFQTFQGRFPTQYFDGASSIETADDVVVAGAGVSGVDATIVDTEPDSGPAVTGTVTVQGTGAPADGVEVTAHRWNVLASAWLPVRSTATGPDGSYALHVPEGTYRIGFSHPLLRYQPVFFDGRDTVEQATDVDVPTAGVPGVDAQVVENHSITGSLTADPVDGLPPGPPPAEVTALRWDPDAAAWEPVSTGFAMPGEGYRVHVPDGTYRLRFTAFSEAFEPTYYDGADNVGEAADVVVDGADVPGIDGHFTAAPQDLPPPWPRAGTLSAPGQDAWGPAVAVAPDGAVTALWSRRVGGHLRVQAATRPAGGSWGAAVNLSPAGQDAMDPQVAAGRRGAVVAVWRVWDGSRHRVQAVLRSGDGWSAPAYLSGAGGDAWEPHVAMGERGTAVAVWRQDDGSGSRVHVATLGPQGRWSAPQPLSAQDAWEPRAAVAADGSAVVAWSRGTGAHHLVEAVTRTGQGRWSAPARLSGGEADAASPQVATNPDGTTAVAWQEWSGSSERVMVATTTPDQPWSPPEPVSPADQSAHQPHVAVGPDGTLTVVWVRWDGAHDRVLVASREPGVDWSGPRRLSRLGEHGRWPQVVSSGAGSTTVAWLRSDPGGRLPMATIRPRGGAWSAAAPLAQPEPGPGDPGPANAVGPVVAAGPDGTVAVLWEQRSAAEDRIRGVTRVDPPGQHCTNGFGVDLNLLFGVPEAIVVPPCLEVARGEEWRPLTIWTMGETFFEAPPDFVPAGETPVADLAAKLESVRVVVDGGTRRERVEVFAPEEAVRLDRVLSEYVPWEADHPMAVSLPRMGSLRAGEHTVEVVWRLSGQHCDGLTPVPELSCLPAGETSFGTRRFTVVSP